MKRIFSEKTLALVLILLALGATYYFYRQGEISFLPQKKEEKKLAESFAIQIPISDKEYQLSYKDKVNSTFNIAKFEEGENWYGDGEFDYSTFYEGESSLFLTSINSQKAVVTLKKRFNITDVLNFKFLVYLATDPGGIEEFNLIFNTELTSYRFPVRDIRGGWNLLVLPKDKFSQEGREGKEGKEELEGTEVGEVVVELVSRPKTRSTVNLDSLWAEKEDGYLDDWNADSGFFLSLKKGPDRVGLLAAGLLGSRATLRKGSAKDYTFQAKFVPLKNGSFGLFLRGDYKSGYGYYLTMNGADTNTWQISKYGLFEEKTQSLELTKGEISNFQMEKEKPYWLKAEMKGQRLSFYFSVDGREFTKLGEASDVSFVSGGLGISVAGGNMVLVDEVQFFQN